MEIEKDKIKNLAANIFLKTKFSSKKVILHKAFGPAVLISSALVCSLFLFYFMALLISRSKDLDQLDKDDSVIEFSMVKKKSRLIEKKRKLPEKKKETKPPKFKPIKPAFSKVVPGSLKTNIPNLMEDFGSDGSLGAGEETPLVRINPQYPIKAQMQGIEGWVLVRFDVTPRGTISNAKVVRSEPPRIFDRSALQAVVKWRYKPRMEGGKAVSRKGLSTRFDYNLDEE